MKVKQIQLYAKIYQCYLVENLLDNDFDSLSVKDLIDFVENFISEEDRERYVAEINIME